MISPFCLPDVAYQPLSGKTGWPYRPLLGSWQRSDIEETCGNQRWQLVSLATEHRGGTAA